MKLSAAVIIGFVALVSPSALDAQGRDKGGEIPASSRPPAGMCRIWLDNVPAAQQPAPTDCASAVRNRPSRGRVIFGDDYAAKGKRQSDTGTTRPTGTPAKPGQSIRGFAPKTAPKKPLIQLP